MDRQDMFTLYEYNAWANARILASAEVLTPEQFLRDLHSSFPSVRDTLAHILGAEWIWLRRWQGESPAHLLAAADFPTLASLKERFTAIERERSVFLDTLPEELLGRPFVYRDTAGQGHTLPLVSSLQHVVNHGTYHRGQRRRCCQQPYEPGHSGDERNNGGADEDDRGEKSAGGARWR
jgi:uncharacterized damage-inducible protein DinB